MAGDKEAKGNHKIKEFLCGKTKLYQIIKFLGEGTYGKVAQCINVSTQEKIAVKIVRKDMPWAAKKELAMLGQLTGLQQNENNLVRFVEHFTDDGHVCLAFEMLDMSLYDMMKESCFEPLQLSEIRVITQQMLVALNSLKSIGLAHADIKPDNIMLVNHKLQPFKVKLIDFGQAFLVSKKPRNILIQGLGYRAPEVILGLPLNEAIDMWGLGCLLAFLYLGKHLYPTRCEYEVMKVIVNMQGQPGNHLLKAASRAKVFFKKEKKGSHTSIWRLNTPAEYKLATFCDNRITKGVFEKLTSLDDLAKIYPEVKDGPEYQDTLAFISLLKGMLQVDAERRITPSQALGHRFITMTHLNGNTIDNSYVTSARLTIKNSQLEQPSVKFERFVTSSEVTRISGDTLSKDDEETSIGSPATDEIPVTMADKKPPACVNQNLDEINTSSDDGTACFVEVKCRKKWFKRIGKFFSKMFKRISCSSVDD